MPSTVECAHIGAIMRQIKSFYESWALPQRWTFTNCFGYRGIAAGNVWKCMVGDLPSNASQRRRSYKHCGQSLWQLLVTLLYTWHTVTCLHPCSGTNNLMCLCICHSAAVAELIDLLPVMLPYTWLHTFITAILSRIICRLVVAFNYTSAPSGGSILSTGKSGHCEDNVWTYHKWRRREVAVGTSLSWQS
jgi:hypothetical protein